MSDVTLDLLVLIGLFAIVTLGLDLIVGYAKIFSVNQAVLFGIGAFTYAAVVTRLESTSLLAAWAIAIPIAVALSVIVGLVSLRVSGDYFVVASFGLQLVALQVIYNWSAVSGGAAGVFGLPYPTLPGFLPETPGDYLVLVGVVAAVLYAVAIYLVRSPYGRVLRAMGEDEPALAAAGFSVLRLKLGAFALGGTLAAIAGVLYGGYLGVAQVSDYSLDVSISLLAMVIVGGAGRLVGSLLGAGLLVLIPHVLNQAGIPTSVAGPLQQGLFGLMLVLAMLYLPGGLVGAAAWALSPVRSRLARRQLRPRSEGG